MFYKTLFAFGATALISAPAMAHTGHDVSSLVSGLAHPLLGLDHLLALFAIAVWGSRQNQMSSTRLMTVFLTVMALGGVLGMMNLALPGVESIILVSVLALGLLVAGQVSLSMIAGITMTAAIAMVHGMAHGSEIAGANALPYVAGYLISCAVLLTAGRFAGQWINTRPRLALATGSAVTLSGAGIALS